MNSIKNQELKKVELLDVDSDHNVEFLDYGENDIYLIDAQYASQTYLSPFVSHRCNSPNAPLPSFSTMIKECLGNSCNCCMSSSLASASMSLQDVKRFAVLDECKLPVDGVNAVLQMAVVA